MARNGFAKLTLFERLLSFVTSVRPGEGRIVFVMVAQIYLLMLSYYLVRTLREPLILTEGSPEVRAYANGAIAVTLIFLIPLYKLLFERVDGNGRKSGMLRWISYFFATNLGIFAFLVWMGIPVAVPFFIWVGVYNVMVIAQFWAFAADLFNVKTGQRLFAAIMVGAALGALTGAQIAGRLSDIAGFPVMMLLSAVLLLAVVAVGRVAELNVPEGSRSLSAKRPPNNGRNPISDLMGGFSVVARSRYLLLIALFIMILNWVHSTGGYILATFVSDYAAGVVSAGEADSIRPVISRVMGDYYSWIAVLQVSAQLFLVSHVFRWFGIRGAVLVLPMVMILNYGLVAMVPVLALVRVMMIGQTATSYSIHGTANHALYLPVTREEKYVGKTTIDTFFYRAGGLAQAGVILVAVEIMGAAVGGVILINLALAIVALMLGVAIGRHHHGEVKQSMPNLPPVVSAPMPDVYVPAGQTLMFSVPEDTFIDPDPGDTLNFHARLEDGRDLPPWIRFDGYNQTFTVRPPSGAEGETDIRVIATDFEGLSVQASFRLSYGHNPTPRFMAAAAVATEPAVPAP